MRKLKKCYNILRQFVRDSTFHGLRHTMLAPHKWMRVVWVLFFATAMSFCCFQMSILLRTYASHPTEVVKRVGIFILLCYYNYR